jgi:polar amino acid transport system substrate-binding protein
MKKKLTIALCLLLSLSFVFAGCSGSSDEAKSINSPDDFAGAKIAVQTQTTADDSITELNENGDISIERYESIKQCFDDLKLGRVDAVYVDSVVASYYTKGESEYKRTWLSDEAEPMGIVIQKDNPELAAAVEAAIDTMYFDGTMAEIANRNFGDDFTAGLRDVTVQPVIPTGFTTKTPGVFSYGTEATYPPMEYTTDDGKDFIGFDIDVANRIGEILGLKVQVENTSWDGIFAGLEKNQYDSILSAVSINKERQEKYNVTKPYVANALCIVTRAGEK